MDHRYIDEHAVAERYLNHQLRPHELTEFEAHVVGCAECTDRILLAQIFLERGAEMRPLSWNGSHNGTPTGTRGPAVPRVLRDPEADLPWPARFAAHFEPWQMLMILLVAAVLLLALPTAYFFAELYALRGAH
jgi:hypothetical protein